MHVMYKTVESRRKLSNAARNNVPSTLGWYAHDCVDRRRAIYMLLQKYSKMQHIFAYNRLP